jgi:integrase
VSTRFPRIKRSVQGVGVIRLASKATSKRQHARRVTLLDELIEADQVDTIRQLVAGEVTWAEIAQHRREKGQFGVGVLTGIKGRRLLSEAVKSVMPLGNALATQQRYAVTWKRLDLLLGPVKVNELAAVDYKALRKMWGRSASDWNHVGRFLSAFLSRYLGKLHPLRGEVVAAFERRHEAPRVPDLSPALFWSIVDRTPLHVRASYVALLLTGMRAITEYLATTRAHLMPHTYRVRVPGTKTEQSAGVVSIDPELWPWVDQAVPSRVRYKWLRIHWCRAAVAAGAGTFDDPAQERGYHGPTLHSLRHALAQWASDEGAGLADVKAALRHSNLSTTEGYARRSGSGKVAGMIGSMLKRGTA